MFPLYDTGFQFVVHKRVAAGCPTDRQWGCGLFIVPSRTAAARAELP
jgi:hypothetical protein